MTMEVRSLPMKGRPLGFQGAIGTFTSESRIDTERVSMGDPVRLVFEISGTGNFAAVPAPKSIPIKNSKLDHRLFLSRETKSPSTKENRALNISLPLWSQAFMKYRPLSFPILTPFRKVLFLHPLCLTHCRSTVASNGTLAFKAATTQNKRLNQTGRRSRISSKRKANQANGLPPSRQAH